MDRFCKDLLRHDRLIMGLLNDDEIVSKDHEAPALRSITSDHASCVMHHDSWIMNRFRQIMKIFALTSDHVSSNARLILQDLLRQNYLDEFGQMSIIFNF